MDSALSIAFVPHVPLWLLAVFGIAAFVILAFSLFTGAHGAVARGLALALVLTALGNPLAVREAREGLDDVAVLINDRSQSQQIGTRSEDTQRALTELRRQLEAMPGLDVRESEVRTDADAGTALFGALDTALSQIPPDRIASVIVLTDGQVHDAPEEPDSLRLGAPFHVLLSGSPGERDRKLTVVRASRFGIVGEYASITLTVEDFGADADGMATLTLYVDGERKTTRQIPVGKETTLDVEVAHGGENVIELEVERGADEQTMQNNRAAVVINGVRDRLRVLLVSGEPHAGERVWRNLLKSDPSVDLVHFTILRPPEKQDATPINELALIAFPTRELFAEKLDQFDLVVFDRYQNRAILPFAYFANLARYLEDGGALLVSSGPEFAQPSSIYRTPLAAVLPAQPSGEVSEEGFHPELTKDGRAHPVTQALEEDRANEVGPPEWGRWFRYIGAQMLSGSAVMQAPGGAPLLVLDRVDEGRVAQLLSDQAWLWARGFEGGGPQAELLRRLAHWLMKEPELEEERLTANISDGVLRVSRQTMAEDAASVQVTMPSGEERSVTLSPGAPGRFAGQMETQELGLYRLSDGKLSTVAAAGPLNPREVADMRATDSILRPFAEASGGSVAWMKDGVPNLREVENSRSFAGSDWFGIARRGAYRVSAVEETQLLPPWAALVLILGTILFAWRREAR